MNTIFASSTTIIEENENYKDVVSEEVYIICDTTDEACVVVLPAISTEFRNIQFYISDRSNNADNNNIFIMGELSESINEQPFIAITTPGGSAAVFVASSTTSDSQGSPVSAKWLAFQSAQQVNPGTGVLGIQAGTNISVDNTDPQYPIISASGVSATGTVNSLPKVKTVSGPNVTSYEDSDADDSATLFSVYKTGDNKQIIFRVSDTAGSQGAQLSFNAIPALSSLAFFIDNPSTRRTGITTLQDNNFKLGVFNYGLTPISDLEFSSNGIVLNSPLTDSGQYLKLNDANQIVGIDLITSITLAQAQLLVSNSQVVSGQQYWITDATVAAPLGVIVIGAPTLRSFQINGIGGFLNCDYQQVGDYSLCESITGFAFAGFGGQWIASSEGTYIDGAIVFYGGIIYQVIDAAAVNGTSPDVNSTAYYAFTKENFITEQVGYIQEWDNIEYDISLVDSIRWRSDKRGNQINNASLASFRFGDDSVIDNIQESSECLISNINSVSQFSGNAQFGSSSIELTRSSAGVVNCTFYGSSIVTVLDGNTSRTISGCTFKSGEYSFELNSANYSTCVFNNTNAVMQMPDSAVSDYDGYVLENDYSTFSASLDITGLALINLLGIEYAGTILLESTNSSEIIEEIRNYAITSLNVVVATSTNVDFNGNNNLIINSRDSSGGVFTITAGTGAGPKTGMAQFEKTIDENTFLLTNGVNR